MRFRERIGLVEPRTVLQTESLDTETRVQIWNLMHGIYAELEDAMQGEEEVLGEYLWNAESGRPIDEYPDADRTMGLIKARILSSDWSHALQAVESFGNAFAWATNSKQKIPQSYQEDLNEAFSQHLVGYRFVAGELVQVTSPDEAGQVEEALDSGGGPAVHLQRALELLSNRDSPQYAKVVHEAISAVESKVAALTTKTTLSDGLRALERSGLPAHGALRDGWTKLYGYTSDAGGIRHGIVRDEEIDAALAVYFLVTSSAFVNYLTKLQSSATST